MYKELAAVTLSAFMLVSCAKDPISTETTENPQIPYSVLFNRHGCEVGRFSDSGRSVYVTLCPENGTSKSHTRYTESCGKSCTHTVDVDQMQATRH